MTCNNMKFKDNPKGLKNVTYTLCNEKKSPEEISLICTFLELTPTVYNSTSILGPRNEHFFSSTIGVSDADTLRKKVVPIRPHFLISNLSQISQVCFFTISVSISVGDLAEWFSNFSLYYNHQGSL